MDEKTAPGKSPGAVSLFSSNRREFVQRGQNQQLSAGIRALGDGAHRRLLAVIARQLRARLIVILLG